MKHLKSYNQFTKGKVKFNPKPSPIIFGWMPEPKYKAKKVNESSL